LRFGEARTGQLLDALYKDPRLYVRPTHPARLAAAWLRFLGRTSAAPRIWQAVTRPAASRAAFAQAGATVLALGDAPPDAPPAQRLAAAERMLVDGPPHIFPCAIGALPVAFGSFGLAGRLLGDLARPAE